MLADVSYLTIANASMQSFLAIPPNVVSMYVRSLSWSLFPLSVIQYFSVRSETLLFRSANCELTFSRCSVSFLDILLKRSCLGCGDSLVDPEFDSCPHVIQV